MFRFKRFSLATLLLLVALWAAMLAVGKWVATEPITNRIAAYEKAPGTRGETIAIGPNRVGIGLVARNDRRGGLHFTNGRGRPLARAIARDAAPLVQAAPWLDVVQFELAPTPDRLDILEIRIFDHRTRTLISAIDPRFGWKLATPDVVRIFGLGKQLPEQLDVWLRLQSYRASDRSERLAPHAGASCQLTGGELRIEDIRPGRWSYGSSTAGDPHRSQFQQPLDASDDTTSVALVFDCRVANDATYQIAAVSRQGKKVHTAWPHFFTDGRIPGQRQVFLHLGLPLAEIDYLEVRPFGGRERFFFEAVQLPRVPAAPFAAPPVAQMPIAGQEISRALAEFAPLEVSVAVHRGPSASAAGASGPTTNATRDSAPHAGSAPAADRAAVLTIERQIEGLAMPLELRYPQRASPTFEPAAALGMPAASGATSTSSARREFDSYKLPLDELPALEVTLPAP